MVANDGRIIWFSDEGFIIQAKGQGQEYVQGVMTDITEREETQETLRKERDLMEQVMETSPAGIIVLNREGKLTFANHQAEQILELSRVKEADRRYNADIWHLRDVNGNPIDDSDHPFSQAVATGQPVYDSRLLIATAGGRQAYISFNAAPLWEDGHKVGGVVMTLEDITHRKKTEAERRKQQEEYQTIFNTVQGMIFYINANNRIMRANRTAAEAVGFPVNELIGQDLTTLIPELNQPFLQANQEVIQSGTPQLGQVEEYHLPTGKTGWASIDRLPYRDKDGNIVGVIVFMNDITERRQREQELEALVSMASALRMAQNRAEMIPVILDQIISLLHMEGTLIESYDPVTGEILLEQGMGAWTGSAGTRIPPGAGISSQVITTGEPYWNNHASSDPRLLRALFICDLEAVACVPLTSQNQTMGAVWVGKADDITERDLRMLTAIIDIAGNALYRATLFDQTQLRLQRLTGLHSIDMAITSSLDTRVTMTMLLDQVTTQLNVDAADVLILRSDLQVLERSAVCGFNLPVDQHRTWQLGEGLVGQVAVHRSMIQFPNLETLPEVDLQSLHTKGEEFRAYFAAPLISKGQVKGVLEIFNRSSFNPDEEWVDFLETLATQAAIAVDNAELFEKLQKSNDELTMAYDSTIEGWSRALELRDRETQGHSERVTDLTMRLAQTMNIPDTKLAQIRRGVLLHDIGKMAIPDRILLKPGPLTDDEWKIMRRHPSYAYDLLSPISYLRSALDVPYSHHEHWDGSGYPRGLKGEEIPLSARIFTVIDVWDALRSDRPYRKAWPKRKVVDYIQSRSGTQFDPNVVRAFLHLDIPEGEDHDHYH